MAGCAVVGESPRALRCGRRARCFAGVSQEAKSWQAFNWRFCLVYLFFASITLVVLQVEHVHTHCLNIFNIKQYILNSGRKDSLKIYANRCISLLRISLLGISLLWPKRPYIFIYFINFVIGEMYSFATFILITKLLSAFFHLVTHLVWISQTYAKHKITANHLLYQM